MQRHGNSHALRGALPRDARERGVALLACMILGVLVLGLMMASMTVAHATNRWFEHLVAQTEALSLAEATTELRQKALITEMANFDEDAVLLEPRTGTIIKGGQPFSVLSRVSRVGVGGGAYTGDLKVWDADGVVAYVSYFQITGRAVIGTNTVEVTRTIQIGKSPVFQYGVFYDDDLEICPGANMTLGGRIHANGDIFLNGPATLKIDTHYLRCTGEIYRESKRSDQGTLGTVKILSRGMGLFKDMDINNAPAERWTGGMLNPTYYANYGSDPNNWIDYCDTTWNGSVKTQAHGTKDVAAPELKTITPGGYYHEGAGLIIESNGSTVTVSQRQNGVLTPITGSLPAGAVALGTLYDGRQRVTLSTVEVDLGLIRDAGYMPANGLIYAFRTDTTAENPHGILFKNGKELAATTMLVSPDPVYIKGDFNAPATTSTYTKKGAMLICDAVNILSNAWNNTKTANTAVPAATLTTVNLAMASGIVRTPDPGGNYSGGLENFPRLHENWSGVTLKIRGSFMCLFPSTYATGAWGNATYSPPTRDWAFDPDLLTSESTFATEILPWAVNVRRVAWQDNVGSMFQ